jgi:hypothetical protein
VIAIDILSALEIEWMRREAESLDDKARKILKDGKTENTKEELD